jgi:cytochrome c-type biogenesis protein CcmH/NrfG
LIDRKKAGTGLKTFFGKEQRMKGIATKTRWSALVAILGICLCSNACGPRYGGYPYNELDTPEQRVFNGFAFLKKEHLRDAQREFEQALRLDPGYSAAYRGMGLVYGMNGDFARAFVSMDQAKAYAQNTRERALFEVGMMSLLRMERKGEWMTQVEQNFERAVSLCKDLPEAYFELGEAYKQAYRVGDAKRAFHKVVEMNKTLVQEAEKELNLMEKIAKADPKSQVGKDLVLLSRITRAETAALIVRETSIEQVLTQKAPPSGKVAGNLKGLVVPPDVVGHRMKAEILVVLGMNLHGLSVLRDGTFGADEYLTRAGYAVIVADTLVRGTGHPDLSQKYADMNSPFHDVRSHSPYFGSIMICSDWAGIMNGQDGYFHPLETVSGVDALLVLRETERILERY